MSLHTDIGWLLTTLLVSVRIAAATAFAPVFGPTRIPAPAKVFVSIALSAFHLWSRSSVDRSIAIADNDVGKGPN